MPFVVTMPKLSPTMEEGTIAKWHKKEGDFVKSGDLLLEVATDKATVEHNALDEGWLRKIIVKENEDASVNQPIAVISEEKEEDVESFINQTLKKPEKQQKIDETRDTTANKTVVEEKSVPVPVQEQARFKPEPPMENVNFRLPTEEAADRIFASPLAKKIAEETGLDLSTVRGSGPRGRIMKKDLALAQSKGSIVFGRKEKPTTPSGTYEEQALSPMRKVIARRLQEAKTYIPHFYVTQTVQAENLVLAKEQLATYGLKVTYNDFVIKACALALREFPNVNSGYNSENNTIIYFKTIDISVAVTVEAGLITPVIRYADYKNLGEISVESKFLSNKARTGKLNPSEYKGGSFTVSNLGMFGVTHFQAIINPPQSAILAVSGIIDAPVVRNGSVIVGKTMNVSLSCDHRVVDGVVAAQFINIIKKYLENPAGLLI